MCAWCVMCGVVCVLCCVRVVCGCVWCMVCLVCGVCGVWTGVCSGVWYVSSGVWCGFVFFFWCVVVCDVSCVRGVFFAFNTCSPSVMHKVSALYALQTTKTPRLTSF